MKIYCQFSIYPPLPNKEHINLTDFRKGGTYLNILGGNENKLQKDGILIGWYFRRIGDSTCFIGKSC